MKSGLVLSVLLILSTFVLSGCASVPRDKKETELGRKIVELRQTVSNKEAKIAQLQSLLAIRDQQLSEKDARIKELSDKLEMFGVFER